VKRRILRHIFVREFREADALTRGAIMTLNQELHRYRRDRLQITTAALSELTGIHRNRLGLYLSGSTQLSNEEIERLNSIFHELDDLVLAAAPFFPSFSSVERIKDLLQRSRAGEFDERIEAANERASEQS
jgi:transcriptional regulator with XRE-family HTH domain